MNTSHIGNIYDPQQLIPPAVPGNEAAGSAQDLSKITDTASLSSLLPRLQSILDVIDYPGNDILQSLDNNISKLQDAFVDAVYDTLAGQGIDLSQKITLRLDEEHNLSVTGQHPDKEKMEQILAGQPEFSAAFKEIASQSELLRDVRNIGKVISARGQAAYQEGATGQTGYQVSLKGEMSHFYFSR